MQEKIHKIFQLLAFIYQTLKFTKYQALFEGCSNRNVSSLYSNNKWCLHINSITAGEETDVSELLIYSEPHS